MRRRTEALGNSCRIRAKSKKRWFFTDFASLPPIPALSQMQTQSRFTTITESPPLHNCHLCIILAFALNHADLMPVTQQIGEAELTDLAEAQSRRVRRHEQGPVPAIEIGRASC